MISRAFKWFNIFGEKVLIFEIDVNNEQQKKLWFVKVITNRPHIRRSRKSQLISSCAN